MAIYSLKDGIKRRVSTWPLVLIILVSLLILGVGFVRVTYSNNLRPVSSSVAKVNFPVPSGSSVDHIANSLRQEGLIRSPGAFKSYVRTNELHDKLQAGTYVLSPSMSVQDIVKKMASGDVAKDILTIFPGKRLDEIKKLFKDAGYSLAEIDAAFDPEKYRDNPLLAFLPPGASLEGYLYPDSFQKIVETPAETIVRQSLDEMSRHLTADIIKALGGRGLNVHEGLTLASIVYQETDDPEQQPRAAQVFLSRLAQNIALQSDVTANYAADLAGVPRSLDIESDYNTYKHAGLPPGPIGNFKKSALSAIARPAGTDYLFFLAGDDGKMHYSRTQAEHDQAIRDHCQKKCTQPE